MGVEGSENADEAAKEAAERVSMTKCPGRFASTDVGHTILERKWKEAKHCFRAEKVRCLPLQSVH